ncbi:hypothetical protein TVAG_069900 [Trichomonas vaginalis G3]|uniref:Uncharacterized protein n=1 Tax=Trichomonas vaginalis (strain ATCC PRA-98 / G3) TaxID=412133 RepID=A2ESN1_TRIV3|nr:hypothetical protein TVAGG3_0220730 [Trichomonas vaginalis G3]EAY04340.1 hypothetical protein TVAG_069900 [Trichomonas vaginalis G3]KAI5551913.1 hypothetical protein TVAGG3_0220730 [Trichomonas vaginalis G3]|eukprot:XP_001316563.1 hypothetical protein [Trichomonas vaginalis G3]
MLGILALRRSVVNDAVYDDDDNWGLKLSYHSPWGVFSIGYDRNEDDDNLHWRWGPVDFDLELNEEEEEQDDDNWGLKLSYHSPWGVFSIGYDRNEDDDNLHWRWGPVDFDLELNEEKKQDDKYKFGLRQTSRKLPLSLRLPHGKKPTFRPWIQPIPYRPTFYPKFPPVKLSRGKKPQSNINQDIIKYITQQIIKQKTPGIGTPITDDIHPWF